jgi:hypothetical protein
VIYEALKMFEMELDIDIIAVRLARLKMTCGAV